MSETGINETAYPELRGDVIASWGPGFEGEPEDDNAYSADAALYGGPIIDPGDSGELSIGLVIALARREEGPEPLVPQTPITVGIDLTRGDLIALRDWVEKALSDMREIESAEAFVAQLDEALSQPPAMGEDRSLTEDIRATLPRTQCGSLYTHQYRGDERRWYVCDRPAGHRGKHLGKPQRIETN